MLLEAKETPCSPLRRTQQEPTPQGGTSALASAATTALGTHHSGTSGWAAPRQRPQQHSVRLHLLDRFLADSLKNQLKNTKKYNGTFGFSTSQRLSDWFVILSLLLTFIWTQSAVFRMQPGFSAEIEAYSFWILCVLSLATDHKDSRDHPRALVLCLLHSAGYKNPLHKRSIKITSPTWASFCKEPPGFDWRPCKCLLHLHQSYSDGQILPGKNQGFKAEPVWLWALPTKSPSVFSF